MRGGATGGGAWLLGGTTGTTTDAFRARVCAHLRYRVYERAYVYSKGGHMPLPLFPEIISGHFSRKTNF